MKVINVFCMCALHKVGFLPEVKQIEGKDARVQPTALAVLF